MTEDLNTFASLVNYVQPMLAVMFIIAMLILVKSAFPKKRY